MHNFKELKVWRAGIDVTKAIFQLTKSFPSVERYGLISQLTRSAISIPSNIAEGSGKRTVNHLAEFLTTALISSFELETQLLICERRKYGDAEKLKSCLALTSEVQKMIFAFRDNLK